ncbi:MAG: Uma2 family endonuclease [Polyangiaceae bacterium]
MSRVETPARDEPSGGRSPWFAVGRYHYVRAPEPIHFPSEESLQEAVSETKRHLEARTTLYLLLRNAFAGCAVGSDQFVYSDAADPRKCLSPDVFVKLDSTAKNFDNWKVWERGAPDLAVEIVSDSDRRDDDWDDDWDEEMARYHASGIREVVRFDAASADQPLRVWDRVDGDLMERAPDSALVRECQTLKLHWVIVPSEYGPQLRLARDREGRDLLPTPEETRALLGAELAEERKARAVAEHERLLAEHARKEAEQRALAVAAAKALAERERDAAIEELRRLRAEMANKA